jgi:CrcB protein
VTIGSGRELAAVFAGGFAGALARVALLEAWPVGAGEWPWATFVANIAGALALGWVATREPPASQRHRLLGTGFCGALTTFSTMQLELLQMLDRSDVALAAAYACVSIAAGLAAVAVTTQLARRQRRPAAGTA